MRNLCEDLIDLFNDDHLSISSPGPLINVLKGVALKRTKKLELELEITASGREKLSSKVSKGTILRSQDSIEFINPGNTKYIVKGLVAQSYHTSFLPDGPQTTYCYSVDALEMKAPSAQEPSYVIEWVGNLSKRLIGNSNLEIEDTKKSSLVFGDGDSAVFMNNSCKITGGSRILHVKITNYHIYVVNTQDSEIQKELRSGYILYKGVISPDKRAKMRECLSFILGLPIVLFGYTEYAADGDPVYMKSIPVFAFGGKAFDLIDLPPFPIASGMYQNITDVSALEAALNALYAKYDELHFDGLHWTYWHGSCAATTMSAVYFGSLCEQIQRIAAQAVGFNEGTLIPKRNWTYIGRNLREIIEDLDIDLVTKNIILNKISAVNQLPRSVALDRLLKHLGLSISEIERAAWRHRNISAHGGIGDNSDSIIFNSRLLRLMFHRLLAAITGCSDRYIDYYNLEFPTRLISEEIPERQTES